MERIVNLLLSADEPVPVEPNEDLKEALRKACQGYNAKKIAEFLPYAFDEYKLNRSMGFGPSEEALKRTKTYRDIRERIYKRIIYGRILNGEPGDLNF